MASVAPAPFSWVDRGRVPGLDGLRALSILLVIGVHGFGTVGFHAPAAVIGVLWRGGAGVTVFFCISGFLITLLLLRERDRNGRISLRAFYVRRFFRIMPAYWVYLAAIAILGLVGAIHVGAKPLLAALTYTVNVRGPGLVSVWETTHTWSLSTEEHFYLVWPLMFGLLGARSAWGPAVVLAASPLIRLGLGALWGADADLRFFSPAQFDAIAAGCLLAYFVRTPVAVRIGKRLDGTLLPPLIFLIAIAGVLVVHGRTQVAGSGNAVLGKSLEAVLTMLLIYVVVAAPRSILCRVLEVRPLVFIGILSYSLYLWQEPFLKDATPPAWWCRWPLNLVLAVVCALASHYIVEQPFLRLKDRLSARATARTLASAPVATVAG